MKSAIEEKKNEIFNFLYETARTMDRGVLDFIDRWKRLFQEREWLSKAEVQEYKNAIYIGELTKVSREPFELGIFYFDSGEIQIGYWKYGELDCSDAVVYQPNGIILIITREYKKSKKGNTKRIYYPNGKREVATEE